MLQRVLPHDAEGDTKKVAFGGLSGSMIAKLRPPDSDLTVRTGLAATTKGIPMPTYRSMSVVIFVVISLASPILAVNRHSAKVPEIGGGGDGFSYWHMKWNHPITIESVQPEESQHSSGAATIQTVCFMPALRPSNDEKESTAVITYTCQEQPPFSVESEVFDDSPTPPTGW